MKKLSETLWRSIQTLFLILLALLLTANLWLLGVRALTGNANARFLGLHWAVVLTGSMEPSISPDDMVISFATGRYAPGDVITYASGRSLTTHRIVGEEGGRYRTQGDANNAPDTALVDPSQILGEVILVIPGVGRTVAFLKSPLGMTSLVLLGFGMIELPHLFNKKNSEECEYDDSERTEK